MKRGVLHRKGRRSEQPGACSGRRTSPRVQAWTRALGTAAILVVFSVTIGRPDPLAAQGRLTQATPGAGSITADSADPERATVSLMRVMEMRVRRDPESAGDLARLAGVYLQRLRETGSIDYLDLASRAAHASLASVPAARNVTGLAALARTEFASHDFAAARDHALDLLKLDPKHHFALLSDALLELGDYQDSEGALRTMQALDERPRIETETRLARHDLLRGDVAAAQAHLGNAIVLLQNLPDPPRESLAWSQWQLGEYAFSVGDYATAARRFDESLATFPNYFNALVSSGRLRAARGDLPGAISRYEQAVRRLPDPTFIGALGDLYALAGRSSDAAAQYRLVEQIGTLSAASGVLYNRQLALFHADHGLAPEQAYQSALKEYDVRHDIYGADAVAWTALKANRIAEAQAAIRLGTRDARLFYHAAMIARAAGEESTARELTAKTLALNPGFDPLQASLLHTGFGQ